MLAPELSTGELGIIVTNSESRGDICESLLGYVYLAELGLTAADLTIEMFSAVKRLASLINECSWLCYQLACRVSSSESFQDWICWVIATVAWRKDVPTFRGFAISLSSGAMLLPTIKHGLLDTAIQYRIQQMECLACA